MKYHPFLFSLQFLIKFFDLYPEFANTEFWVSGGVSDKVNKPTIVWALKWLGHYSMHKDGRWVDSKF